MSTKSPKSSQISLALFSDCAVLILICSHKHDPALEFLDPRQPRQLEITCLTDSVSDAPLEPLAPAFEHATFEDATYFNDHFQVLRMMRLNKMRVSTLGPWIFFSYLFQDVTSSQPHSGPVEASNVKRARGSGWLAHSILHALTSYACRIRLGRRLVQWGHDGTWLFFFILYIYTYYIL